MDYLYHHVPPGMKGTVLYPLNQLKNIYPEQYEKNIKKYEGREYLLKSEVPPLHCLWNDVLHLTAVSPDETKANLALAGIVRPPTTWFKIPVSKIIGNNSVAFIYRRDKNLDPQLKDYEEFTPERMNVYRTVPTETIEYYKEMTLQGKRPLVFNFVPHILYKGTIETRGLETVTV